MFKKNNPGCACCEECDFFSDDFNRADDDDPGDYTEVSGDWDIVSNKLSTASSTGVLTGNTANPNSDSNTKISVTVNIATDGDKARIILAYLNSSNYWFAEVKAGTGAYLKIYQRSGGTDTQMATVSITRATATDFTFCASISSGSMSASVGPTNVNSIAAAGTFTDTGWGLGTGTLGGTVTFDDLTASIVSATCPRCSTYCGDGVGSDCCLSAIAPPLMKLVVTGVANAGCSDCANLNGTYYLAQTGSCFYRYDTTITNCGGSHSLAITLSICDFFFGSAIFDLILVYTGSVRYQATFSTDYDCNSWVDEDSPTVILSDGVSCDWSSATKLLTSIP